MTAAADIDVRDLRPDEMDDAIAVLARGMRDNPPHVAVYGKDAGETLESSRPADARPARRLDRSAATVRGPRRYDRRRDRCRATGYVPTRTGPAAATAAASACPRAAQRGPCAALASKWGRHDPTELHVHLGLFAVDAHLQGHGIGSRILAEHCRRLDTCAHVGYLETDKRSNVVLYERFGFAVVGHEAVLGVPCWYMRRDPDGADSELQLCQVRPLGDLPDDFQKGLVVAGYQERDGARMVAVANTFFMAPLPGADTLCFADFRQMQHVPKQHLHLGNRAAAKTHDCRVSFVRRWFYFRFRLSMPMDQARDAEAARISADPDFEGPRPDRAA